MIKKIQKIKGVGKFYDYTARGDNLDFGRNTLIFANNGYGKSTLTAILKSFSDDKPDMIVERRTLIKEKDKESDSKVVIILDREVVIKLDQGQLLFQGDAWRVNGAPSKPILKIFDQQFVYENLFLDEVTTEHKKKIHEIVIGKEGVELSKKLTETRVVEREAKATFGRFKSELEEKKRRSGYGDYLNMPTEEKIKSESEIEQLEKDIKAKMETEKIKALPRISKISRLEYIDIDSIKSITERTPRIIGNEARDLVLMHFVKNLNHPDNAAKLIQEGIKQRKSDSCPFCGQKLSHDAEGLMDAYSIFYDEGYHRFQQETEAIYFRHTGRGIPTEFEHIRRQFAEIKTKLSMWTPYLGDGFFKIDEFVKLDDCEKEFESVYREMLNQLEEKIKNLDYKPNLDWAEEANDVLLIVNNNIALFNRIFDQKNEEIEEYIKKNDDGQTLENLGSKLDATRFKLNRFSDAENTWINDYKQAIEQEEEATKTYEEAVKNLNEYSQDVFRQHESAINQLLNDIGANFQIAQFGGYSDRRTNQPYVDFCLTLNECSIGLTSSQPEPCFKNTLSAGDRNALAFAFFIACLKSSLELPETILVMDDPLNSLDKSRRAQTAIIIREISQLTKQTIVLTHKRDFLYLLQDNLERPIGLTLTSDSVNGSKITAFDITKDRKSDHCKRIDLLTRYVQENFGPQARAIQEDIRIALETSLQFKYYPCLDGITTLGSQLDKLDELGKLEARLLQRCRELNNISSPGHHGATGFERPLQAIERDELITYVRETLNVLELV